jgi:hypothetical protein
MASETVYFATIYTTAFFEQIDFYYANDDAAMSDGSASFKMVDYEPTPNFVLARQSHSNSYLNVL